MKKILFAAAIAAVAATSCTKSDVVDIRQDVATDGISFNAFTSGTTKAQDITTTNLTDEVFLIQAYNTAGAYDTTTSLPSYWFYDSNDAEEGGREDALVCSDDDIWYTMNKYGASGGSKTIYFWPTITGQVLSFFATNAVDSSTETLITELTAPTTFSGAATDYPSFDYTINAADMQDLLVANTMDGEKGGVELNFEHALAKLNFKAQGSSDGGTDADGNTIDYEYTVVAITVKDLYTKGTFTFDGTDGTLAVPGEWSSHATANTTGYTYELDSLATLTCKNNEAAIGLAYSSSYPDDEIFYNNSLLVLPQDETSFSIDVQFYVTTDVDGDETEDVIYPLKDNHTSYGDATAIETAMKDDATLGVETMNITLGSDTFTLEPRSQTTLTLVLPSPGDLLTYKVDVNDWDDEDGYNVGLEKDEANETETTTVVTSTEDDGKGVVTVTVLAMTYDEDSDLVRVAEIETTTDTSKADTEIVTVITYADDSPTDASDYTLAFESGVQTTTETVVSGSVTTVTVTEMSEDEDDDDFDIFESKVVTVTTTGITDTQVSDVDNTAIVKSVEVTTYASATDTVGTTVTTYYDEDETEYTTYYSMVTTTNIVGKITTMTVTVTDQAGLVSKVVTVTDETVENITTETVTETDDSGDTVSKVVTVTDETVEKITTETVTETDGDDEFVSKEKTVTTTGITDMQVSADDDTEIVKSIAVTTYVSDADTNSTTVTTYYDEEEIEYTTYYSIVTTSDTVDSVTTKTVTATNPAGLVSKVVTVTDVSVDNITTETVTITDQDGFVSKVKTVTTTGLSLTGTGNDSDKTIVKSVEVTTYDDAEDEVGVTEKTFFDENDDEVEYNV